MKTPTHDWIFPATGAALTVLGMATAAITIVVMVITGQDLPLTIEISLRAVWAYLGVLVICGLLALGVVAVIAIASAAALKLRKGR